MVAGLGAEGGEQGCIQDHQGVLTEGGEAGEGTKACTKEDLVLLPLWDSREAITIQGGLIISNTLPRTCITEVEVVEEEEEHCLRPLFLGALRPLAGVQGNEAATTKKCIRV